MGDVNQKIQSVEMWPRSDGKPFTGVMMGDKKIFDIEKDCGWEIKKVFTDYTLEPNSHKCLVVVFEPVEES